MKTVKTIMLLIVLSIGQFAIAQQTSYKDVVTDNPNAEKDIKVVTDYIDALMTNKMELAASLMTDTYVGSGPADKETETKAESITSWTEVHKTRTNQRYDSVYATFRVKQGDLKGDWVSIWGTYYFTENGVDAVLPFQFTAMVEKGKIATSIIYYDRLAISKAMGMELVPKSK